MKQNKSSCFGSCCYSLVIARAMFWILLTAQFLAGSHHSLSFVFAQFISVVESGEFCLRPSLTRIPEFCAMVACYHSADLAGTCWVWLSSWSGQVLWLLSCFSQWILLGYSVLTKTLNWKVSNNPGQRNFTWKWRGEAISISSHATSSSIWHLFARECVIKKVSKFEFFEKHMRANKFPNEKNIILLFSDKRGRIYWIKNSFPKQSYSTIRSKQHGLVSLAT